LLSDVKFTQFNEFHPNPTIKDAENGISKFKAAKPDIVLAVGGGSVIDLAKAINALAVQKSNPEKYITGKQKLEKKGKPLIAIPTTSGTGSEVTRYATIYIENTKYSLTSDEFIIPDVSIIDPFLTETMTPYLTASTGLDALCQAIESMWAVKSTQESRKLAKEAIKTAIENLEKAVNNSDKNARTNMAKSSNLSGKAINISRTTACHSISYPITSYFNIPHGHAVALTMPEILVFNYGVEKESCNDTRGVDFVKERIDEIADLVGCNNVIDAKDKLINLMENIGVETKLSKLDIDKKGVELIIKKGFTPNRMNNNPRNITKNDLKKILEEIL
jgi:alcohol dehydrogenase class IV